MPPRSIPPQPLVCVLQDGSLPVAVVATPQPLSIPQAVAANIYFVVVNNAGAAPGLSGAAIILTVWRCGCAQTGTPLISRQAVMTGPTTGYFQILASDTLPSPPPSALPGCGDGFEYDIAIAWPDETSDQIFPPSPFEIPCSLYVPGALVTVPAGTPPLGIGPTGAMGPTGPQLGFPSQLAAAFYGGPTGPSGATGAPGFRYLAAADLPASGVTAASYRGFAIDAIGRVTSFLYTAAGQVNPRDSTFGAVGNNIADDTTAIQAAINYAAANGTLEVHVPPGTYRISSTLQFSKLTGLRFIGAGPASTRFVWAGAANTAMMNISGCQRCRFEGFALNGSGDSTGILHNGILSPAAVSTLNVFEQIFWETGFNFGMRIGSVAYQCDQGAYIKCDFFHCAIAGVSIEDSNAVVHNFYDCAWQYCDAAITAIRGTGGSFCIWGGGFAGNGVSASASTSYDIAVYPSSRGTVISGCWSEGSYRFLRTAAGSTDTQVSLIECSVNGSKDATGAGVGLAVGILWESSGGLNIIGGKYEATYQGVTASWQIQVANNNNTRANINIVGTGFNTNPVQTTAARNAAVHVMAPQSPFVMDVNTPPPATGFLARGSASAPLTFSIGNTMIWAPSAWLKIASGTTLSASGTTFQVTSKNCQGQSRIAIDQVLQYGGCTAPPLMVMSDQDNSTLQMVISPQTTFRTTSDFVLRVTVSPEPWNIP